MADFVVSINFQTTAGNPATRRIRIKGAKDEGEAMDRAFAKAKKWKRCMKIDGGDCTQEGA